MGFVSHHVAFAWSVFVGVPWHPHFKKHLGGTNFISVQVAKVNCIPHLIERLFEVWSVFWGSWCGVF